MAIEGKGLTRSLRLFGMDCFTAHIWIVSMNVSSSKQRSRAQHPSVPGRDGSKGGEERRGQADGGHSANVCVGWTDSKDRIEGLLKIWLNK